MAKQYNNGEDVLMRLHETVVFYKGRPYYVSLDRPVPTWQHIVLHDLTTFHDKPEKHDPIIVKHTDDDLDTTTPELGYTNHGGNTYYLSRPPLRRQNQGLNTRTLISTPKNNVNWLYHKGFWNTLMNIFPNEEEALEKVKHLDANKIAISRTIAIGYTEARAGNICMFYGSPAGDRIIAILDKNDRFILLPGEDTSFIRRFLNKSGVIKNVG